MFVCFFSVRSVMHKYLEKTGELTFDKIFNQRLGIVPHILLITCTLSK